MIDICLASDRNYLQHLLVTMASVLMNSDDGDRFRFCILSDGSLAAEDFKHLGKHSEFEMDLINAEELMGNYISIPSGQKWPMSAFYRLLLPFVCPSATKVLYLDCDIIVRSSVAPLWHTPMEGFAVAGVVDNGYPHRERLLGQGVAVSDEHYINSGVSVWNLEHIRSMDYGGIVKRVCAALPKPAFADQCWINIMFDGRKKVVPVKWNVMSHFFSDAIGDAGPYTVADVEAAKQNPAICHFTNVKPWTMTYTAHPYWFEYWQCMKSTPYWPQVWKGYVKKCFLARENGFLHGSLRPLAKKLVGGGRS